MKVAFLGASLKQGLKTGAISGRASRVAVIAAFSLALALLSTACTNNLLGSAVNLLKNSGNQTTVPPVSSGGNGTVLTLSRVQKDNFAPTTTLDLIGDGSGSMGQFCASKGGNSPNSGPSTCTCAFTFTRTDGVQIGPVEVDTSYHENDQIRCIYSTVVPNDVSKLSVYVHITSSDTVSNTQTFNFTGTGISLDLTNPASYSLVKRYQCRDIISINYLWDGSVYDPFLSEDPRYTYPLDFYTTNMGKTMELIGNADPAHGTHAPVSYNCPTVPVDTSTAAGLTLPDLRVFSVTADPATGSKVIFPPPGIGNFDRSTYYLAKAASGVFSMPVNAYTLPDNQPTTTQPVAPANGPAPAAAGQPPLGFAAAPIPLTGGGESCPDVSVSIPKSYHWAKLWLFRKQLPQRTYPFSSKLAAAGQAGIACNPAPWGASGVGAAGLNERYFTDCRTNGGPASQDLTPASLLVAPLAYRALRSTAVCVKVTAGNNFVSGLRADRWDWVASAAGDGPPNTSTCSGGTDAFQNCANTAPVNAPHDTPAQVGQGLIDPQGGGRTDYLFVVTPTNISRSDMDSSNPGNKHSIYTPTRFTSPTDCVAADPDHPTIAGDCNPNRLLRYDLIVHDVGSGGNPDANAGNRSGDFPLCVLQPD